LGAGTALCTAGWLALGYPSYMGRKKSATRGKSGGVKVAILWAFGRSFPREMGEESVREVWVEPGPKRKGVVAETTVLTKNQL